MDILALGKWLFAGVAIVTTASVAHHISTKERAFSYAKSLVGDKGIINLGAGPHRTLLADVIANSPEVRANLDIVPDGLPNFMQWDIEEPLPFGDKTFDVTFASHVLEHLDNWQFTMNEATRVADHAVIVLPHPLSPGGWLNPYHKQHFSTSDMAEMESTFPNTTIFY